MPPKNQKGYFFIGFLQFFPNLTLALLIIGLKAFKPAHVFRCKVKIVQNKSDVTFIEMSRQKLIEISVSCLGQGTVLNVN